MEFGSGSGRLSRLRGRLGSRDGDCGAISIEYRVGGNGEGRTTGGRRSL